MRWPASLSTSMACMTESHIVCLKEFYDKEGHGGGRLGDLTCPERSFRLQAMIMRSLGYTGSERAMSDQTTHMVDLNVVVDKEGQHGVRC